MGGEKHRRLLSQPAGGKPMDELSDKQVATLRQCLLDTQARLRVAIREELIKGDDERYADLAGPVHDEGEEAVADMLSDLNVTFTSKLIQELREVEAALGRIEMGIYGRCEECGTEIPYQRLEAYPTARRCIKDQERHERLFPDKGTPSL